MRNELNRVVMRFPSKSINEGLARSGAAAFASQLDPTLDELGDIRTAVSEAVTNAIVHGYKDEIGEVIMTMKLFEGDEIEIVISDKGCGIPDVGQARQPLYTTDTAGERSGMGFTVMESFTDALKVTSKVGQGTTVTMWKKLSERGRI